MTMEEWRNLKVGDRLIRSVSYSIDSGDYGTYEVIGLSFPTLPKTSYPDYDVFNAKMGIKMAIVRDNWEIVK